MLALRFSNVKQDFPSEWSPVKVRFVLIAFFLLIAVVFLPLFGLKSALLPALFLTCVAALGNLIPLAWISSSKWARYRIYFAVSLDVLSITIILHYLGGIESSFWWIYVTVLIAVALMHGLRFGLYAAGFSIFMYSMLLITEFNGIVKHVDRGILTLPYLYENASYLYARVLSSGTLFFIAVVIPGLLTERLLKSKSELEKSVLERTGELSAANEQLRKEITRRDKAENFLRVSEEKHRKLVENMPDRVLLLDHTGKILYINFTTEFASRNDVTGRQATSLMQPESAKIYEEALQRTVREKTLSEVELLSVFDRHYRVRLMPLGDEIMSIGTDITEQKRMESAMRQSERKYRSLVDLTSDSVYELDKNLRYTYVSDRGATLSGRASEDHIGKTPFDFMPEEEKEWIFTFIQDKFDPPQSLKGLENTLISQDGKAVVVETSAVPVYNAQEEFVGYLCVDRDITERKRAEALLRQSEKRYRSLFEESRDVVYITTPEGRIVDMNPAGIELLGYSSKEELLEVNVSRDTYWDPRDREAFQKVIAENGFVRDYELHLKRKDGKRITVLLSSNAVRNDEGEIVEYRGIMHDVTLRRQMEYQLHQSSKLASVGQLATGVAHEINNPIAAIDVHAGLVDDVFEEVRDRIDDSCREQIHSYIDTIHQQVERCSSITNNLLSFARTPRSEERSFGINELLRETARLVSSMALADTDVKLKLDHELPSYWGSPNLLQQVFVNLLTNAFRATGPQDKITISTCLDDSGSIRIQFTDTGYGMTEDVRDCIFDPFFTTSPEGEGTGLGLSISYYIVKQMNGEISVDSTPGQGSTFTVTLPIVDSPT